MELAKVNFPTFVTPNTLEAYGKVIRGKITLNIVRIALMKAFLFKDLLIILFTSLYLPELQQ